MQRKVTPSFSSATTAPLSQRYFSYETDSKKRASRCRTTSKICVCVNRLYDSFLKFCCDLNRSERVTNCTFCRLTRTYPPNNGECFFPKEMLSKKAKRASFLRRSSLIQQTGLQPTLWPCDRHFRYRYRYR